MDKLAVQHRAFLVQHALEAGLRHLETELDPLACLPHVVDWNPRTSASPCRLDDAIWLVLEADDDLKSLAAAHRERPLPVTFEVLRDGGTRRHQFHAGFACALELDGYGPAPIRETALQRRSWRQRQVEPGHHELDGNELDRGIANGDIHHDEARGVLGG